MGSAVAAPPRRRGRSARWGLSLLTLLLTFFACEGWEDWDTPFRRRYYGWKTSDGGSTVLLPGPDGNLGTSDDQILWAFGDTVVNPPGSLNLVFGNTIGIHPKKNPVYTPPSAPDTPLNASTELKFYARQRNAGTVIDITWSADAPNLINFFRRSCSDNKPRPTLLWPGDGVYRSGELQFFTFEVDPLTFLVQQTYIQRYGNITASNGPADWSCVQVPNLPPQYSGTPSETELNNDPPLLWGVTLAQSTPTSSTVYVFGTRVLPGFYGTLTPPDAVLARVTSGRTLYTFSDWEFLYKSGTQGCAAGTGPCYRGPNNAAGCSGGTCIPNTVQKRNDLHLVARGVREFSVDRVTHSETGPNGTFSGTRWIMVHGLPASLGRPDGGLYTPPEDPTQPGHYLYFDYVANHRGVHMRSAQVIEEWPSLGGTVGSPIVGSSVARDYLYWGWAGSDIDKKVITGFNAYRNIHALKAHGELSEPGGMLISYYVWGKWFCDPTVCVTCPAQTPASCNLNPWLTYDLYYTEADSTDLANQKSAFRFTKAPLNRVYPWCQAWPGNCVPFP